MVDLREHLTSTLAGAYTIEHELGGGGMARVFVAEERRLGRKVVIKVLPPEIGGSISIERFAREIQLIARLQHPHIVPLLAAGDADGMPFYTMPFIQGESLRHRLRSSGKLPRGEAIRLACEIADALAYAHAQGIIHRDIKPENILLSGGHALVADFGIAKAVDAAKTHVEDTITVTGMFVGTPAYISPEQAIGEPVDERCDVYSLGAVLYEMLAGAAPFTGSSAAAIIARRFAGRPGALSTYDAAIPVALEQVVDRALALSPDDRFAHADDLIEALRGVPDRDRARGPRPESGATDKSIAVLPFANMSSDPESEYFSDGITEEIINALAQLPGLDVAARTSSFAFKGKTADVRDIGAKLGVGTVLEGTVRRAGKRIRITAQLIKTSDGYHLWSERYDRDLEDVFAIQDEIAQAIARKLAVTLGGSTGEGIVKPGTTNLEAYDLYLRGRSLWNRRGTHLRAARDHFEQAIAADPAYAAPLAGLADVDTIMVAYGYATAVEVRDRTRAAAYRALELNAESPESHNAVGLFEAWIGGDFVAADREFQKDFELNPAWAMPRTYQAFIGMLSGRRADVPSLAREAVAVEPMGVLVHALCASALVFVEDFAPAVDLARRGIELDPSLNTSYLILGWTHQHFGRRAEAVAALREATELSGRAPLALVSLGGALAELGEENEARAIAAELGARHRPLHAALVLWALGEQEPAFVHLGAALRSGCGLAVVTSLGARLGEFMRDARILALLRETGHDALARAVQAGTS